MHFVPNVILHVLVSSIIATVGRLPLRVLHKLGAVSGNVTWIAGRRKKQKIERELEFARPDLCPDSRARLGRHALKESFKCMFEVLGVWANPDRALRHIVDVRNEGLLQDAMSREGGLILCVPHLGSVEVLNLWISAQARSKGYALLYRKPSSEALDRLLQKFRGSPSVKQFPISNIGIRAISQHLKYGGIAGILPDHVPSQGRGSVLAPFFGVPVTRGTLLPRLAQRFEPSVITAFAERLQGGRGFRIHFDEMPTEIADDDISVACATMNAAVESCIARAFTQYDWSYKRFR
jgi:KDO2-lipid IV(A) lauroyltransferase